MSQYPDEFLSPKQVGAWVNMSTRTLLTKRDDGSGPKFVRIGTRRVFYRRSDVEAWLASRTFKHRAAEVTGRAA